MAKKRSSPKPGPAKKTTDVLPQGYAELLGWIKERIRSAQLRASLAVNREMVLLYWQIGREILTRQEREGWGAKVIDRLAVDLRRSFPDMTGLSPRNLKYMRAFAAAWPHEAIVQAALAQITWYHNIILLEKLVTERERLWYARSTVEHGWSRNVLVHWIESDLYQRQGKAVTNFQKTLPALDSEFARETLKDPYSFEFLTLTKDAEERAPEGAVGANPAFLSRARGRFCLPRPAVSTRGWGAMISISTCYFITSSCVAISSSI